MSEPLSIFQALYDPDTKKVILKVNSGHIPMVCYAKTLLDLEIADKILESQISTLKDNKIVLPKMGIEI